MCGFVCVRVQLGAMRLRFVQPYTEGYAFLCQFVQPCYSRTDEAIEGGTART